MTGFLQQQPAAISQQQQQSQLQTTSSASGVQEIPLDMKAVQDHMAVQALVRSYQVCIVVISLTDQWPENKEINPQNNISFYLSVYLSSSRCVVTR